MFRCLALSSAMAMGLLATSARAEVTGTVTVVSDYDFRGITQTSGDPGLQGNIDYAGESGFSAGIWAGNVDFGDCCDESVEVDVYAAYSAGETFPWSVGAVYYGYPGADAIGFPEIYGSLGYRWLSGKISYTNDWGGSDESALYYEANGTFELPKGLGLSLHVGYSDGDYWDANGGSYSDYSVGLSYAVSHFTLGLKWIDGSDFGPGNNVPDDVGSSDARAVFSIATTFPWNSPTE